MCLWVTLMLQLQAPLDQAPWSTQLFTATQELSGNPVPVLTPPLFGGIYSSFSADSR